MRTSVVQLLYYLVDRSDQGDEFVGEFASEKDAAHAAKGNVHNPVIYPVSK